MIQAAVPGTLLVKALYRDETPIRFLTEHVHSICIFNPCKMAARCLVARQL
jgi:hypothetical protein